MLKKVVQDIHAAEPYYVIEPDGWTTPTGAYVLNTVASYSGVPFFVGQETPQGYVGACLCRDGHAAA